MGPHSVKIQDSQSQLRGCSVAFQRPQADGGLGGKVAALFGPTALEKEKQKKNKKIIKIVSKLST